GMSVISINLSSGLSGTVESAHLAQESLGSLAEGRLHIIDSLAASMGQGLLVCLAAELAQTQKTATEIVEVVTEARRDLIHLFTLDTMENLVKGGRISRTKATLGELLNIKPILWLNDEGKIDPVDKVRGRKKSLKYLLDRCVAEAGGAYPYLGISHANCPEEAEKLAHSLRQALPEQTIVIGDIGATIGTHTGAGCIAVFYFR
ncbi:MAG: DegV family protein, partial [Firmicutes bacterium]|nr:DegV family protein [Bacillota bacterium]